jgi:hypothetical protein
MDNGIPVITATDKEIVIKQIPGVDIDTKALNEALLTLPAKTYLALYHEMHVKIYGYPPLSVYGGCCGALGDAEDNAKYYSEQPKVTKSYAVGE